MSVSSQNSSTQEIKRIPSHSALTREIEKAGSLEPEKTVTETPQIQTWTPETTPATSLDVSGDFTNKIPINTTAAQALLARSSTKGSLLSKSYSLGSVNSFDERHLEFDFAKFEEFDKKDEEFETDMKKAGKNIVKMLEDGNCFFRALAHVLFNDQERHQEVRETVMDYMEKNRGDFEVFITEDMDRYLARKRRVFEYANEPEIMSATGFLKRPIHIYCYSDTPTFTFEPFEQTSEKPICLTRHRDIHYNLLVHEKEDDGSRPTSDIFDMTE